MAMDHGSRESSEFDRWTRRKFGLLAGGLTGSLLGLAERQASGAAKKVKKRRAYQPKMRAKEKIRKSQPAKVS